VEDIESCPLLRPALSAALAAVRTRTDEFRADTECELASSEETAAWAVCGSSPEDDRRLPRSLRYGSGGQTLLRTVGAFTYRLTPSCFFQANDWLIEPLARRVDELTAGQGLQESALELYSGVGLFTLPLARRFLRVAAVESSPASSAHCRQNLKAAGLGGVHVDCADVPGWLRSARPAGPVALDLVLLDPPRTGAGPDVMDAIAAWGPASVVYVACDLPTLCRDASRFRDHGYRIDAVAAFDLFPQTHHFETIVRFRRESR
jgi:23S rRNA (uracil1939-C5)-methyltransferase